MSLSRTRCNWRPERAHPPAKLLVIDAKQPRQNYFPCRSKWPRNPHLQQEHDFALAKRKRILSDKSTDIAALVIMNFDLSDTLIEKLGACVRACVDLECEHSECRKKLKISYLSLNSADPCFKHTDPYFKAY